MRRGYRRPPFLTIGVSCVWLHSANCSLSIRVLVSAFVVSVSRSHIYADICIFLMFAVNTLRVRRYWQSANLIANMCPKCIKNYAIIHQNTCKIHPKSTKMVPRSAQKAALAASLFQVSKKTAARLRNGYHCGATWGDVGRHFGPPGRQGAPKIELFGTTSH